VINRAVEHSSIKLMDAILAFITVLICLRPQLFAVLAMHSLGSIDLSVRDAIAVALFVFLWHWVFELLNAYNLFITVLSRVLAVLKGIVIVVIPALLYVRVFHPDWMTPFKPFAVVLGLFAFEFSRIFITYFLIGRFASRNPRRAVIVGTGRRASKAWREIRTNYHSSMAVLGFIDDRDPDEMAPEVASRYLGGLDDLASAITSQAIDLVLIAAPMQSCYPIAKRAIEIAENIGVSVGYLGDIYVSKHRARFSSGCIFSELAPDSDRLPVKRLVDIIVSLLLLAALSPLMLAIAIAIKLTSRGSILFRQKRYGYRKRLFTMYKFRTMTDGADSMLLGVEAVDDQEGPVLKIRSDLGVTSIGRFLRITSLDQLPQLLNVLTGAMSFVGPRSMLVRDVSHGDTSLMLDSPEKQG
jgi:Bacterial sugar transferase/CoA-binding domain